MKYPVIIEKTRNGYGGSVIDIPGLHAVGDSPEEVRALLRAILIERMSEMRNNRERIPKPTVVLIDSVEVV